MAEPTKKLHITHCTATGLGQAQGPGLGPIDPNVFYRNAHTGPREVKEPGRIESIAGLDSKSHSRAA